MNCNKCKKLISMYVDNCINDRDLQAVLHHIDTCDECRAYYNALSAMVQDLSSMESLDLPKGYENKLHFALERAKGEPKTNNIVMRRVWIAAASAIGCLVIVISSMSVFKGNGGQNFAPQMDMAMEAVEEAPAEAPMAMEEPAAEEEGIYEETEMATADDALRAEGDGEDNVGNGESKTAEISECNALTEGSSIVLVLDVEDEHIDAVYDELASDLDLMSEQENWVLHIDEPDGHYRSIRTQGDVDYLNNLSNVYVRDYNDSIDSYYIALIEYEQYAIEMATFDESGYLYIIIK